MENDVEQARVSLSESLFTGGGEMGALMGTLDWSATPVGPVESWPQSLRTSVSICLASRFPILILWGADLVMLYNDAFRPILGASKHPKAMGQRGRECWPEIWNTIGPMLNGVLTRGEATWSEDQLLLLDRNDYVEECTFTFSYSPIHDESGGVSGVFCVVTETTSKVLGERRLRSLRELAANTSDARTAEDVCATAARALATNTADMPFTLLYLLDADGKYVTLAGAANLIPGTPAAPSSVDLEEGASPSSPWSLAYVVHTSKAQLVSNLDRQIDALPTMAISGAVPRSALVLPVMQSGQEHPYGLLVAGISPHRALDDDYRGFFDLVAGQIAIAIADARAYEQERERAEALAELDRAKTAFFSNVSHEFRTPLTLLLGPVEDALADDYEALPPLQRERVEVIQRNGLRLLKLVNTLLDFSRIEAGRAQAVYEPTDLATYTVELASNFRSAIERAGLRFVVDCPPLPEPVYVDHEMWEKIVLNLLSNAVKFTFAGEITVRLRAVDDAVSLEVRDTGIGIPNEEQPRLFERFHRVQGARARSHEGSGIGLALVHDLARLHGGNVSVTSRVGEGTTFTVTIPTGKAHLPEERIGAERTLASTALGAAPYVEEALRWLPETPEIPATVEDKSAESAKSVEALANEADQQDRATSRAHILLADDNADMRDYLTRLLSARWQVETVPDGTAALAAIREHPPDLVLSDVMMPGLDGFQLLQALRADERTHAIPVILLSARAGEESAIEGLKAGADDYLVKPFSARELLARVATRLDLTSVRREAAERASQLEATFGALTGGIFVYDAHGSIMRYNAAATELFGFAEHPEFLALSPDERAHLLDMRDGEGRRHAPSDGPVNRVLRGETLLGATAHDITIHALDGHKRILSTSGAPMRDEQGRVIGGVLIFHDVTERKQAEQRLAVQHAVSRLLIQEGDSDQISAQVLQTIGETLGWQIGLIWMVDEKAHVLRTAATWHAEEYAAQPFEAASQHTIFAPGVGLPGRVWASGMPTWVVDAHTDTNFPRATSATEAGLHSAFAFPLSGMGSVVGVIEFFTTSLQEIDENLLLTAATLGNLIGQFIERKALERAVEERASQLEAIFDATPDAVTVYDRDGQILRINAVSRRLAPLFAQPDYADQPRDEHLTQAIFRNEHGQPFSENQWPQGRVLRGEMLTGASAVDITVNLPDGGEMRLSMSGAPMRDAQGHIIGAVCVFRDVTERRQLEQSTHEALQTLIDMAETLVQGDIMAAPADEQHPLAMGVGQRLVELTRSVLGCHHAAIVSLDSETKQLAPIAIVGLAPQYERQWWKDVPKTPLDSYLDAETIARLYAGQAVVYDLAERSLVKTTNYGTRGGLILPMCIASRIVGLLSLEHRNAAHEYTSDELALAGAIAKVSALAIERERLLREREEVRASEMALREANRRMDEFLSIAGHEMRTPLTSVKANVQLMARRLRNEAAREQSKNADVHDSSTATTATSEVVIELLERLDRQVDRLSRLVNDLLDVSRIQAGKLEMRMEPCDLATIIRECTQEQQQAQPARTISLDLPTSPVLVVADPDRIGQVATNYLTNALKYSQENKPVAVGLRIEEHVGQAKQEARLWVRDEGPGLPPEEHERIWERFHRAPNVQQQSGSGVGLGLGLHISKTIIEQHQGAVGVESTPAGGSTFWFTLPLA